MSAARKRLIGLGNRCEVKLWIPAGRYIEIAADRTDGMVDYFHEAVRGMDFLKAQEFLSMLVRSAYMQGVTDAADAMARSDLNQGGAVSA